MQQEPIIEEGLKYYANPVRKSFYDSTHPNRDSDEIEISEKSYNAYMAASSKGKMIYWDEPGKLPVISDYRHVADVDNVVEGIELYYRRNNPKIGFDMIDAMRTLLIAMKTSLPEPSDEIKEAFEKLEAIEILPDKEELIDKVREMDQQQLNNFRIEDHIR